MSVPSASRPQFAAVEAVDEDASRNESPPAGSAPRRRRRRTGARGRRARGRRCRTRAGSGPARAIVGDRESAPSSTSSSSAALLVAKVRSRGRRRSTTARSPVSPDLRCGCSAERRGAGRRRGSAGPSRPGPPRGRAARARNASAGAQVACAVAPTGRAAAPVQGGGERHRLGERGWVGLGPAGREELLGQLGARPRALGQRFAPGGDDTGEVRAPQAGGPRALEDLGEHRAVTGWKARQSRAETRWIVARMSCARTAALHVALSHAHEAAAAGREQQPDERRRRRGCAA